MLVTAIITAGGQGIRMGEKQPKQFLPLAKKTLLAHAVTPFQNCPRIDEIILVVPEQTKSFCQLELVEKNQLTKIKKIVAGGKQRADSVYNGLLNVGRKTDYVLIHDGVRPFVKEALIARVLDAAIQHGAAVPGLEVKETIKSISVDSFVEETLERSSLIAIQTPQAYRYNLLFSAYQRFYQVGENTTDDSQFLERDGYRVKIVPGADDNLKVTIPLDLEFAEFFLQKNDLESEKYGQKNLSLRCYRFCSCSSTL